MSRIFWLASYPKSGNTWLRVFLANLTSEGSRPVNINEMRTGGTASDRNLCDDAFGVESADMTEEEIERYRPEAYRHLTARSSEILYIKIHDAFTVASAGEPLVPPEVSAGAVYLIRNPLDVAVSFADHLGCTIEAAVEKMGSEKAALSVSRSGLKAQVKQRLLSWSSHVSSWLEQDFIPVHMTRYEDLSLRPIETFTAIARFLGLPGDSDRIRRAVDFSTFEVLREQEQAHGFRERSPKSPSFFRQGRLGVWREALTPEQTARVIDDHGPAMRRFGYLPPADRI